MNQTLRLAVFLGLTLVSLAPLRGNAQLFPPKESQLRVFGTYLNQADEKWGGGIGLDYFPSSYAGIGMSTHMENTGGTAIDNLTSEAYIRWPIEKWHMAPYAVGGGGYEFDKGHWFQSVGGGLEFRFSKRFGLFADWQYVFHHDYDDNVIRAGIRVK
jgi:hypothetical protein